MKPIKMKIPQALWVPDWDIRRLAKAATLMGFNGLRAQPIIWGIRFLFASLLVLWSALTPTVLYRLGYQPMYELAALICCYFATEAVARTIIQGPPSDDQASLLSVVPWSVLRTFRRLARAVGSFLFASPMRLFRILIVVYVLSLFGGWEFIRCKQEYWAAIESLNEYNNHKYHEWEYRDLDFLFYFIFLGGWIPILGYLAAELFPIAIHILRMWAFNTWRSPPKANLIGSHSVPKHKTTTP